MTIIDMDAERKKREEKPDPEFVMFDDIEQKYMYKFLYHYTHSGKQWSFQLWAYDREDAEARLFNLMHTTQLDGQLFNEIEG